MNVTLDELERFHDFAVSFISFAEADVTWLQLFEHWHMENPMDNESQENVAAIREALDDMHAGRMRPFDDFDADFRTRHAMLDAAGMFRDDPLFDDWQRAIAEYRREADRDDAAP